MPRVRINIHDVDEFEELEARDGWERQYGLTSLEPRREIRDSAEARTRGRGERREVRFGGAEARERKRAERRKQSGRFGRRPGQQRA